MRRDLTDLAVLLNRNAESGRNNPPAARRHSRILNADPKALIAKNLVVRGGLTLDQATRCDARPVTPAESARTIAQLDRLLKCKRRGPRQVLSAGRPANPANNNDRQNNTPQGLPNARRHPSTGEP